MVVESRKHLDQKSPYDLIQERYLDDPWRIMIVCIMLNLTRGRQVKDVINQFFEKYPTPQKCAEAHTDDLTEIVRSLGMWQKRTMTLIKFSQEWINGPWGDVSDLFGIGKYARDAWAIFVECRIPEPETINDGKLKLYAEWARNMAGVNNA